MARTIIQLYRGTTAQNNAFTGSVGELTMDTITKEIRVHDGVKEGGHIVGTTIPSLTDVCTQYLRGNVELPDEEWKGRYSPIYISTNLTFGELLKVVNKQYVIFHKYSKQNRKTSGRARGKMAILNDRRVPTTRRFYCYRYENDNSYVYNNPKRWVYLYCEYDNWQEAVDDDATLYTSLGTTDESNLATNINCLADCGNVASDFDSDSVERYEDGDINEYIEINSNNLNTRDYFLGKYIAMEYTDGTYTYFVYKHTDTAVDNLCYIRKSGNTLIPEYVPRFFDELTGVQESILSSLTFVKERKDLFFRHFDFDSFNLTELSDYLYSATVKNGLGAVHQNWTSYWFDYPIRPFLLSECEIYIPQRSVSYAGKWLKFRDFIQYVTLDANHTIGNFFADNEKIKLKIPYDTAYIWLRLCGWQKRCCSNNDWVIKNDIIDAQGNGAWSYRAFGGMRGHYMRVTNDSTTLRAYVEFNLADAECVYTGRPSRSTPIQKRLTITNHASVKQDLRD